MQIILQKRNKF